LIDTHPRAGYLAVTKSNEDSCLSRFSNEETLPQPCLKHRAPRIFFEHNIIMRSFGRLGFEVCDRHRQPIFLAAFALSLLGWVFSIAAAFAYTLNDQTVRDTAWGIGDVADGSLTYFVGLQELVVSVFIVSVSSLLYNRSVQVAFQAPTA